MSRAHEKDKREKEPHGAKGDVKVKKKRRTNSKIEKAQQVEVVEFVGKKGWL